MRQYKGLFKQKGIMEMKEQNNEKQFECIYDESGTEVISAQVMDAYNDGTIGQAFKGQDKEQ